MTAFKSLGNKGLFVDLDTFCCNVFQNITHIAADCTTYVQSNFYFIKIILLFQI
jgi:hypothetical protein